MLKIIGGLIIVWGVLDFGLSWIGTDNKPSKKPVYFYPNKKKKINSGLISTFSNFTVVSQNKILKL